MSLFEDDTDEEESQDEVDEQSDAADSDDSSEGSAEKRIRALQSKADKAEARANKAEAALKAGDKSATKVIGTSDSPEVPEAVREWLLAAETRTREALYDADPRFKKFNIDPALISGNTPQSMAASQKALVDFVNKLEGEVRNEVLVEHGFAPEPKASERSAPVNYATMTSEEFAKYEAKALSGGQLRRS